MKSYRRNRPACFFTSILPVTLIMAACDNPAPGEGMLRPLAEEPLPEVVPAAEALRSPDLTTLDPGTLDRAEIEKALPAGPQCSFKYTAESLPVLAAALPPGSSHPQGVVKLYGRLVQLTGHLGQGREDLAEGATFTAEGMRLTIKPEGEANAKRRVANMQFKLDQGLLVGYRGWYGCTDKN